MTMRNVTQIERVSLILDSICESHADCGLEERSPAPAHDDLDVAE